MMKNKKIIIRTISIMVIIILAVFICIFSLSYRINSNYKYKNKMINNIKNKYTQINDIDYINSYNDYYIFTTKDKVYVLDNNYKEVYKEDLSKLAKNTNNYELIYRDNKLMYENTIRSKDKITYEYYNSKEYKKVSSTVLER